MEYLDITYRVKFPSETGAAEECYIFDRMLIAGETAGEALEKAFEKMRTAVLDEQAIDTAVARLFETNRRNPSTA